MTIHHVHTLRFDSPTLAAINGLIEAVRALAGDHSPDVLDAFNTLQRSLDSMAHTLQEIQDKLAAQKTVIDSVVALITTLRADVTAAAGDQTKIDAIFDEAEANSTELANSLLEGTPQQPATPLEPTT